MRLSIVEFDFNWCKVSKISSWLAHYPVLDVASPKT